MNPIDFNPLDKIAHSDLAQDLTQQTIENIKKVQTPTQTGFVPKPVVTPLMQEIISRQNALAAKNAQKQPPLLEHFFLAIDGEAKGPYTVAQVKAFLHNGTIDSNTYCWKQGYTDWVILCSIPELMAE